MTKDDRYGATQDSYDDEPSAESSPSDERSRNAGGSEAAEEDADAGDDALPFIFARRTVKADREAVPVYLQTETADLLQRVERSLESEFDGDKVMSLDVREAIVRAGLDNVDDVEDVMREWGYGRR